MRVIAETAQLQSAYWLEVIRQIELMMRQSHTKMTIHESKRWEYPWTWKVLQDLMPVTDRHPKVLDIGTRKSPFPWWLLMHGYDVILSEVFSLYALKFWIRWMRAERNLRVKASKRFMDARKLAIPDESIDVYLSNSVIEHIRGKEQVLKEAYRVLRPNGLMILTFDIVEPAMGMESPAGYESLSMKGFDDLIWNSNLFVPARHKDEWNTEAIPDFLRWMREHKANYVVGGAAFFKKH
ncbi:class I SAM-dependent methyltransferase [bacterium]|nr:class I SAM-dependent methyltransferase [bacterium]